MDNKEILKGMLKEAFFQFEPMHGQLPHNPTVPVRASNIMIWSDPKMDVTEKMRLTGTLATGARDAGVGSTGIITPSNIIKGALGAGIGYTAAKFTGKALGAVFGGLQPSTQKALSATGALAGFLRATNII